MDLDCYNFDCFKRLDDLVEAAEAAETTAALQTLVVVVVGCFKIGCYYFLDSDSDNFS